MGHTPRIGYQNYIDDASTIVASNEAAGYEKENGYDWLTYDWWKPGATGSQTLTCTFGAGVTPDYFACYAHNLGETGASIVLQYDDSGWTDAFTDVSPTGTEVVFKKFTASAFTGWRVLLTNCTVDTMVGVMSFGDLLEMPQGMRVGFSPPTINRNHRILNSVSVEGAFIGRSRQHRGHRVAIQTDQLTPAWIRSDWAPFMDHAELKPFFFAWDDDNFPAEAAYCWSSRQVDAPVYSDHRYMRAALTCDALVE